MSLFIVLKYLCMQNNASFPRVHFNTSLDIALPLLPFNTDSNDVSYDPGVNGTLTQFLSIPAEWNASESTCDDISYSFEYESFQYDENTSSETEDSAPGALSMCQPYTPEVPAGLLAELFGDILGPLPTLLVCATVSRGQTDTEECDDFCTPCNPGTYGYFNDNCSDCLPGSYSSVPGSTICAECSPGKYSDANGSPECFDCPAGTYTSVAGSTACHQCHDGANFSEASASTTCTQCSVECPLGREYQGPCTAASDTYCAQCPPVANCIYTQAGPCGNSSSPNCECAAGFEMVADGQCATCLQGFFKNQTSSSVPCMQWDETVCPEGHFPINGTRFHNAACMPCPDIPENASFVGTECEWVCDAGFNNTAG